MRRAWRTLTSHARYTVGCDWRPSPSPYRRRSVPLALAGPGVSPGHLPLERAGQAACGAEAKRASINRCLEQQEGKKKNRTAIYLALGPVQPLSLFYPSHRSALDVHPSCASSPTSSLPFRRPPSSPSVPSAACWLGAISCHPSPVEAQTLQQSTNLLPASSCKSLPPRRQLHSWARTASKLAGAVSRAKKSTVLGTCTCRRADVRFGVELGVQRRAWVWTRVRGVCQRGVGGSA